MVLFMLGHTEAECEIVDSPLFVAMAKLSLAMGEGMLRMRDLSKTLQRLNKEGFSTLELAEASGKPPKYIQEVLEMYKDD